MGQSVSFKPFVLVVAYVTAGLLVTAQSRQKLLGLGFRLAVHGEVLDVLEVGRGRMAQRPCPVDRPLGGESARRVSGRSLAFGAGVVAGQGPGRAGVEGVA